MHLITVFFSFLLFRPSFQQETFQTAYQWSHLNFTWRTVEEYEDAIANQRYIPENNAITGIKYYKERIYLALPRPRPGTPVTLAYVPTSAENQTNVLLTPYPSWEMNVQESCSTLQNVLSMEIDTSGIMWVLDGIRAYNRTQCPPKLVLLDLNNDGNVVETYEFSEELCPMNGGFLHDIVVDEIDSGFAYITEHSSQDPGIIVYSRLSKTAWKFRDTTMFGELDAANFSVGGVDNNNGLHNLDGIALTTAQNNEKIVIYCSMTGFNLYGISANILKDQEMSWTSNWRFDVKILGRKTGQSDGIIMDNQGNLYYGLLPSYGVGKWNINEPFSNATIVEENPETLIWADNFMFDEFGYLYVIACNVIKYFIPDYPLELNGDIKFRILKIYTGANSYLYG